MRYLGVDFGTKKIGLAFSDEAGKFAFPFSVIHAGKNAFKEIKKICGEKSIFKIILGKPGGYKGDAAEIIEKAEKFKKGLEENTGLSVIFESEVLSTQQAKRIQGKGAKIDASAAAIILQSFLDKSKN
ncbi:MAG: Holliday junction resolvase RuvX [Candidatus Pacebacteria bacterium]|nr:Holliday junction resolvase RuvX [Candidatus Paceibacterota bacterium]